ncbi:hypothetical protein [Nostoc sp. ChiSLP03a]|uniref:hypothetical protein n=1 Tax=Nostoc sp. ChiSLP03a TaxID=3075380 RepID=UPI002AD50867|nr:hypothetical protein [Nostoc sp. ChiSLP03a]MDZ8209962.1 hypothetical protein [Nostoc sp. ChiSLP03a]
MTDLQSLGCSPNSHCDRSLVGVRSQLKIQFKHFKLGTCQKYHILSKSKMYETLNINDFRHILYIIRDNHKKHDSLTHKQVRVYLDCMEQLWEKLDIPDSYWLPSIKFHFSAMSCRISHEKRAFLASELLKLLVLLKQDNKSNTSGVSADHF